MEFYIVTIILICILISNIVLIRIVGRKGERIVKTLGNIKNRRDGRRFLNETEREEEVIITDIEDDTFVPFKLEKTDQERLESDEVDLKSTNNIEKLRNLRKNYEE